MKVAFASQLPLCLASGGLELQVLRTARALQRLGVETEFLDPWKPTFDAALMHCFSSEYQLGDLIERATAQGIPVVVTAVFLPRTFRVAYRMWRGVDPLIPAKTTFGLRRRILHHASRVIALSQSEARDLVHIFGIGPSSVEVVPNGVDSSIEGARPDAFRERFGVSDFVLCVASVERRKNQLRLIEALRNSRVPLVLIGQGRADEADYVRRVEEEVKRSEDILWIPGLPPDSELLLSAYAAARVHALPSLSEGQPLALLEAAATGANIVMSDLPYLRELFGDYAWYCNPRSPVSIREAVMAAWHAPRGVRYTRRPPWLLSWDDVARRLVGIYEAVLSERRVDGRIPGVAAPLIARSGQ
jgi:glycosyltransferase involved in cell wall biosynthesis